MSRSPYRWPFYSGLWCLAQASLSLIYQRPYALHELFMGLGALSTAALFGIVQATWRFVHGAA